MIAIDFVPGTHGNFLSYICNRFIANIPVEYTDKLPFNDLGAAHDPAAGYHDHQEFVAGHYYQINSVSSINQPVVSIDYTEKDLLQITQICFLRAGDLAIDTDSLHINTYNKLDNDAYRAVLDNLVDSFGKNLVSSYDAVKDPSWPAVSNIQEYQILPRWIRDECENKHGLVVFELSSHAPHCPRGTLREFFKLGFIHPERNGFMQFNSHRDFSQNHKHFSWPFDCFYNFDLFKNQLQSLANWCDRELSDFDSLPGVHQEFMIRQPYSASRARCHSVIDSVITGQQESCQHLNLVEQAYVDAQLELQFGCEMPTDRVEYFATTQEIKEYIAHGR